MTSASEDILRQVARMSAEERFQRADELVGRYTDQLTMPLHRQILDCLVGRQCTSKAAQSWAVWLIRESRGNHSP